MAQFTLVAVVHMQETAGLKRIARWFIDAAHQTTIRTKPDFARHPRISFMEDDVVWVSVREMP